MNGIAYGPRLETPVRMEMIRLGIVSGAAKTDVLARILASDEGYAGLSAGEADGRDACDARFSGPYFSRVYERFTNTAVWR